MDRIDDPAQPAPAGDFYPPEQLRYLRSQPLGRLATVGSDGQPRVAPVGFRVNRDTGTIDIGGRRMRDTAKFRRVRQTGRAALGVDDLLPPWQPRGMEISGRAEAFDTGFRSKSPVFDGAFIRLHPDHVHVWGDLSAAAEPVSGGPAPEG